MLLTSRNGRSAWCWAALAAISVVPAFALFSVQDDILAFPQFQISMSDDSISDDEAARLLIEQTEQANRNDNNIQHYETLTLQGEKFLCSLPILEPQTMLNASEKELSKSEEEKELRRAQASGWDLLEPLNGTCLYYMAGWWTYSFCHKVEVKQFHQLAPQKGVTLYPPKEDPHSKSYILGRVPQQKSSDEVGGEDGGSARSSLGEETTVQSAGEMRYLVQKIGGGSVCDLTGRERKIEIQFHCNQNSHDKIAWIKEVTTCRYLMVIHTPRLCQDVAYLPPKEDRANEIKCQRILLEEDMEKSRSKASLDAEILAAMVDHDIDGSSYRAHDSMTQYESGTRHKAYRRQSEPTAGERSIVEPAEMAAESETVMSSTPNEEFAEKSSTNSDSGTETDVHDVDIEIDSVFPGERLAAKSAPDLVTSTNMLIRDIKRQMAAGTFLTPEGKVASADDEFSYSVALVDVNGQVIGVVTVVVSKGKVQVELDQSSGGRGLNDRKELLDKFPQKLKDELREFSGGAQLDGIASGLDSSGTDSSSPTDLVQNEKRDVEKVDGGAGDSTDDKPEQREGAHDYRIVIRDEL
ncbi:hypothetical protein V1517DRAFT_333098 [Lipomyces orientalis]|uniref:Uncharacterized protein n=1 Tax=Lipomyces orientalis TaxID=1233043 RepID=A0ACC3TDN9_9ASCO